MRGKEHVEKRPARTPRITPAYAGKSIERRIISKQTKDHPRLCGEKLLLYVSLPAGIGSPPPMRGKGLILLENSIFDRITPAYAGKRHRCL